MERAVFTELAGRYKDTVFRVALNCLGSPADADDIVQETLLRLLERSDPFENAAHAKYWLIRVALNLCKNLQRSPWRRHAPLEEAADVPVFDRPEQAELYAEVMALPEKYRTALYLFYYEGYSVKEIAEILGIRVTAVTSRLSRARQKLKFQMTEPTEGCCNG
ncbi:MAG: RNA polymerase sigma factor [Oscillospiraceae bacterium]|nr:RNA polymerase sigma factor [Oscillospiraceae bacterium]